MKRTLKLSKEIRNTRDGYHLNSKYWQEQKQKLPYLPIELFQIAVGMILSDACMYKISNHALIKFEQGYIQEEFLFHLFFLFKDYCFMIEPGKRIQLYGDRKSLIKSFWFKTFSHVYFDSLWELFYKSKTSDKIKFINKGLISNHLTERGLAYWVMGDGSLNKKSMILHTQSYSEKENSILSKELNGKFGFKTKIVPHKNKYWVIKFSTEDTVLLSKLIKPYIIPSMIYKLLQI
jgi:LAGLIDADG DNA endonuclease family